VDRPPKQEQRLAWILLASAMAVAVAFLFWLQRGLAFDGDSFNWILLSEPTSAEGLITPYGGHLILTPFLTFKAVLELAGASYTAMGVVQVALLLLLSGLVYEYGRRRLSPLLALPPAILILFLGSASSVLMQPMIGIQFLCALVPGVAGLLALERSDTRGDVAACVLFSLATVGFEMGLAFVAGGAVGIALRDDRWRRAWIVAIPFVIYGVWRVWAAKYGGSGIQLSNVFWIPAYAADSLGVVGASLFGLFIWPGSGQLTYMKLVGFDVPHLGSGLLILMVEIVAVALVIRRLLKRGPIPATFWVALAVLVSLWIEQGLALGPGRTPGEVRYVFADTVAFLLVALECAQGIRVTRRAVFAAALLTVVAIAGNQFRFQDGRDILVEYSTGAKAAFAAIELDGSHMDPGFNPATEAPEAFVPGRETYIGPALLATLNAHFGRFGYSLPELLAQSEGIRRTADLVAAKGMGLEAVPSGNGVGNCGSLVERRAVKLPPGGAVLVAQNRSPLRLRRFGGNYAVDLGVLQPKTATIIRVPKDAAKIAWHAYAPDAGRLSACPLNRPRG
jgi:hypothetical protein